MASETFTDDFWGVVARRYSCRSYRPDPVPRDLIERVLDAARLAPSACNKQPWRFAVVTDAALRRRVVSEGFLPGIRMTWALDAGVLLVLGIERSLVTHVAAPGLSQVDYPWIDAGIAGEHAVLAAEALGLGTCWIGWIRARVIRRLIGWPVRIKPAAVIAVGYPAEPRPAGMREAKRKSKDEFVTWCGPGSEAGADPRVKEAG